jgi:hypothetical protein
MVVTATDGSATAGGTEVLNLQLVDQFGSPVVGKALSVTVTVTGSATFTANDIGGTNGSNTLNGTLSASGSGSVTITNTVAETVTVSADATGDAQVVANVDDTVTFDPGALDNFLVEAAGGGNIGAQTAGTAFNIQITARDANNNTVTSFDGAGNTVEISSTGTLTAGSGTTATFTNGVLSSHSVTISNTGSFTITATDSAGGLGTGSENGTSNSFTVNSGPASVILHDNTSSGYTNSGSNTLAFQHTIGCGSNRLLVVSIAVEGSATYDVNDVTYNGVSLTRAERILSVVLST